MVETHRNTVEYVANPSETFRNLSDYTTRPTRQKQQNYAINIFPSDGAVARLVPKL